MVILRHEFQYHGELDSWEWIERCLKSLGTPRSTKSMGEGTTEGVYNINGEKITLYQRLGPSTMLIECRDRTKGMETLEFILSKLREVNPGYPYLTARV